MTLKTNYQEDVYEGNRKYTMTTNSDNSVSLVDVTDYSKRGDTFGANDINATNIQVNENTDRIPSAEVAVTLSASGWSTQTKRYTITNANITATSNQEILPARNITAEQLEALQNANIQDYAQAAGNIVIQAYGDLPTINIPIRLILRGVK